MRKSVRQRKRSLNFIFSFWIIFCMCRCFFEEAIEASLCSVSMDTDEGIVFFYLFLQWERRDVKCILPVMLIHREEVLHARYFLKNKIISG